MMSVLHETHPMITNLLRSSCLLLMLLKGMPSLHHPEPCGCFGRLESSALCTDVKAARPLVQADQGLVDGDLCNLCRLAPLKPSWIGSTLGGFLHQTGFVFWLDQTPFAESRPVTCRGPPSYDLHLRLQGLPTVALRGLHNFLF